MAGIENRIRRRGIIEENWKKASSNIPQSPKSHFLLFSFRFSGVCLFHLPTRSADKASVEVTAEEKHSAGKSILRSANNGSQIVRSFSDLHRELRNCKTAPEGVLLRQPEQRVSRCLAAKTVPGCAKKRGAAVLENGNYTLKATMIRPDRSSRLDEWEGENSRPESTPAPPAPGPPENQRKVGHRREGRPPRHQFSPETPKAFTAAQSGTPHLHPSCGRTGKRDYEGPRWPQ